MRIEPMSKMDKEEFKNRAQSWRILLDMRQEAAEPYFEAKRRLETFIPRLLPLLRHASPDNAKRYYALLKMRWQDGLTLEEVGKMFGVTRERIRQMEAKTLEIIKAYEE